jgi:hypothetical protein
MTSLTEIFGTVINNWHGSTLGHFVHHLDGSDLERFYNCM